MKVKSTWGSISSVCTERRYSFKNAVIGPGPVCYYIDILLCVWLGRTKHFVNQPPCPPGRSLNCLTSSSSPLIFHAIYILAYSCRPACSWTSHSQCKKTQTCATREFYRCLHRDQGLPWLG